MPKIIINEIDNTTAGSSEYANFSVVVPGVDGLDTAWTSTDFDENGICEFTSQAEFVEKVGIAADVTTDTEMLGINATPNNVGTEAAPAYWKTYTSNEFAGIANIAYTLAEITEASQQVAGKLKFKDADDKWYKFTKAEGWIENINYAAIEKANVGVNPRKLISKGNRIAYELLGLGFTVLYKHINLRDETSTKKPDKLAIIETEEFWKPLMDKSLYDYRYICTGLSQGNAVANKLIANLATWNTLTKTGRGDCTALMDIPSEAYCETTNSGGTTTIKPIGTQEALVEAINEAAITGDKYSSYFAPNVKLALDTVSDYGAYDNILPASFYYLACAAYAFNVGYAEWYADAGYIRGVSKYKIESLTCKLGDEAINFLQPRTNEDGVNHAVNVITKIKNNYYLWGNRTAETLNGEGLVASHFLNIRQLCTTIKKQLYVACRKFTFEPNSDTLWFNFCNTIKPLLNKMKADNGIDDYKIIQNATTQKATLSATIRIVPIEAVEDFEIDIVLEDSIEVEE